MRPFRDCPAPRRPWSRRSMRSIAGFTASSVSGRTVGFARTGQAARSVENVLLVPHHEGRGLTVQEVTLLTKSLQGLREAASRELQAFYTGWR